MAKIPIVSVYDQDGNRIEVPAIVGRSAYQSAQKLGYTGSEAEWIESLRGNDGRSIKSIVRTEGDGTPGTTDTYTITYTDNESDTFTIHNGADRVFVGEEADMPAGTRVRVNPGGRALRIPRIDDTLEKPGYAADAKATGDKINNLSKEIADKLDADKLPEAINTALAQAKESGEFDGEPGAPGDDYVLTDDDKTEIAEEAAKLVEVPGAGNTELIEFITLTEDTSSIVREVMPDGTPYGFKSVFAVIAPVQVWSNKWIKTSAYYDKAIYGFDPSIPNTSPDTPNKKVFAAHKTFNLDGQFNNPIHAGVLETGGIILSIMSYGQTNPGYHNSFQTSIAAKIEYNTNKAKIIKFELISEVPLISGTRVLLFGVRA